MWLKQKNLLIISRKLREKSNANLQRLFRRTVKQIRNARTTNSISNRQYFQRENFR